MISAIFRRSKCFVQQVLSANGSGGTPNGGTYLLSGPWFVSASPTAQSVPSWCASTTLWQWGVQDGSIIPQ